MKGMGVVMLVWFLILSGWVVNIVKLCRCDFEAPYKTEIVRGVSALIPIVGTFTGWMDIGEEVK